MTTNVELSEEQIKATLQGISIPPQPQIMVDLQMEQVMPDPDLGEISKLISQDIGLSGSILKTVNSSFYGLSNKVTSINQAVQLLGANTVINLTNALTIRGELSDDDILSLGRFWDVAMEVAMASASIAKHLGYHSPDEAYSLGLFHNCGIPLLMKRFDNYQAVMEESYTHIEGDSQLRIIDLENQHFKTNHAVVGYYIAKSWKLPPYLCEAIHEHHSISKVFKEDDHEESNQKTLVAILKMAEHICGNHKAVANCDEDLEWSAIEETVLQYCHLSEYDFSGIKEQIHELGIGHHS